MANRDKLPAILMRFWITVTSAYIKMGLGSSNVDPIYTWAVRLKKRSVSQADKANSPDALPTIRDAPTTFRMAADRAESTHPTQRLCSE